MRQPYGHHQGYVKPKHKNRHNRDAHEGLGSTRLVERLSEIQPKIDRADEHIMTLEKAIRAFLNSNPYEVNTTYDDKRQLVYYVSKAEPIPSNLPIIAADAIQNLRSALDHLAYQLYLIGTGGATVRRNRQTQFPVGMDATKYAEQVGNRTNGMRADAITVFNSLEPYKGGKNEIIWKLSELNNLDKHRLLITVGSHYASFDVGADVQKRMKASGFDGKVPPFFMKPADNLFPLKKGDQLFSGAVGEKPNPKQTFKFAVVLDEPSIDIRGADPLALLNEMSKAVVATVSQFNSCLT